MTRLEAGLHPAVGETSQAGGPVTFYADYSMPFSIAVASSPQALGEPDVDSGPAVAARSVVDGPGPMWEYTFTSAKASAAPGTVYWQASFPSTEIPSCAGLTPTIERTQPRALTVLPSPPPPPPAEAPKPPSLQTRVVAAWSRPPAHPGVSYRIECMALCSGRARYRVLLVHAGRAHVVPSLDLAPSPITVADDTGATTIAGRFTGRALRRVRRMLHAHQALDVQIDLEVIGVGGGAAQAEARVRLRL